LVYGAPHDEKIRGRKEELLVEVRDQNKLHPSHDFSIFPCLCCGTCGGFQILNSIRAHAPFKAQACSVKALMF
jgi:hypothetical protein